MESNVRKVNQFTPVTIETGKKSANLIGPCFLIAVFIAILYFNSLGNQFTNWDDGMIYQNPSILNLNWEGIKKIFSLQRGNTYQPIRMLSYAIDYHFWKLNPAGFRLTNILFYILTCIMVFFTLRLLLVRLREHAPPSSHQRVALFGALLFAAHPVHVEAVTWLAARKEVLQGFFFFLAFYLYLRGREERGQKRIIYLTLVLFSVLLATLSKPSAVVFPGVILIYEISKSGGKWIDFFKKHWVFLGLALVISVTFTFVLLKVMFEAGGIKHYRGGDIGSNILLCLYVFLHNIKLLIFTINYSAGYSFVVSMPIFSLKNVILMLLTIFLFAFSILSLRRTKVIFFSFFFFLITLLPYLNIIPISTLKADRYVFIASFSFAFLLGIAFDRLYAFQHKNFSQGFFKLISIAFFLFLLLGYSFMTIRQNTIWQNSYTLWADAVEKHPESSTANALLGVVYMDLGMDQDAVRYLEKAVQLIPYDYQSYNNLGIVYGRMDEPEKATEAFATAMWLKPDDDTIKINLSVFYQRQKEYQKAEEVLKNLLSKNPKNANLHYRLGLVYKDAGDYEAAISQMLKSMALAPHIINPYEELGNLYASHFNDIEKAKHYYSQCIQAMPKGKSRVEDMRWMVQDLER
ncbi:MAG: tetratricopeptide repeat protein [Syntrophaceae bacterium]|nr:tetratricopeptide repeat protein [Syntrophaceae bacterium]